MCRITESKLLDFVEDNWDTFEFVMYDQVLDQSVHALVGDFFI